MKKIIISLVLAIVTTMGATSGTITAFAETKRSEDTPVTQIADDNYLPYSSNDDTKTNSDTYNQSASQADFVDGINQMVEASGGNVKAYASEREYLDAQEVEADAVAEYADDAEEVKQVITVMTTATGSEETGTYVPSKPVANAIVRINGVPRFTDRNGQIEVTLPKDDYAEVFVEKSGFNPYTQEIDITGEEKIINIKQPGDEIDIYAVNLTYDDEKVNLLTNNYSIDKIEEPFNENFIFEILCTAKIEQFIIYQNGKTKFSSAEHINDVIFEGESVKWTGKKFSNFFDVGGDIEIEIFYKGLTKKEQLKLSFLKIDEIDLGSIIDSSGSDINVNTGDSFIERINLSFTNQLRNTLKITPISKNLCQNKHKGMSGQVSFSFEILHDNKSMSTKIAIGVIFDVKKSKGDKQEIFESFKESYDRCRVLQRYNIIQSLRRSFNCPGLTTQPCGIKSPGNKGFDVTFTGTILGYIEISDEQYKKNQSNDLQEEFIKKAGIEVTFGVTFDWTKNCVAMVAFVPIPYYLKIGFGFKAGFNFMWSFSDGVDFIIEFVFRLYGKLGIGLGIGQILGVNIYGKLEGEFKIYLNDIESYQFSLAFIMGLEGKIFWFSFDIPLVKINGILAQEGAYKKHKLEQLLSYKTQSVYAINDSNVGSEPQIVKYGDNEIKVWVEDTTTSEDLNASKLYYSVRDEAEWSEKIAVSSDNLAESSPVLKCVGDKLYLAWMKSNALYDNETTLGDVIESGEICIAEFDNTNKTFGDPQRLTEDYSFDAAPRFVQSNSGEVALVWQRNTANDILGTSGTNQLFISKLINQKWETPECVFETEKPIIDFEACIENNQIVLSYILDDDLDLETFEDRGLYIKKENQTTKIVNDNSVSDLQFSWINGDLQLLFLQDGKIKTCKFKSDNEIYDLLILNSITNSFRVETFNDAYVISFLDAQSDGKTYLNVSIMDSSTDIWSEPFAISDSYEVKDYSLMFADNKFNYFISVPTRNDNGKLMYCTLCEDEYVLNYDIALEEIVLLDTVKPGTNKGYCFVSNVGSYPIETLKICVAGVEQDITLNEPLQPSHNTIVDFDFFVENLDDDYLVFSVSLNETEKNLDNNSLKIKVGYSDIKMEVDEKIYKNNQTIKLFLNNEVGVDDSVRIVVHKKNLKGEIIYISDWISIKDSYELNLELDYNTLAVETGDTLCIELLCSNEQIEEQSYTFKVESVNKVEFNPENSVIFGAMNFAKALTK